MPYAVRFRIGYDLRLVSEVLAIALRSIFSWQRRRVRKLGITHPLPGAITLCQRYGSLLQFSPHFHSWLPDGVFYLDEHGALRLCELPPPEDAEVEAILWRIHTRVETLLAATEDEVTLDEQTESLLADQPQASMPVGHARLLAASGVRGPRCAAFSGCSLHANLAVEKRDRKTLERLLRYGLRPPFAQRRLSLTADGRVRLALRKPTFGGQRSLLLEPLDFLRRLLAPGPTWHCYSSHRLSYPGKQGPAAWGEDACIEFA